MEQLHDFFVAYAPFAHWIIFGMIIAAGFNIPFSLDALAITAAMLASTIVPENMLKLFLAVWVGATLSAWVSYWFGRSIGSALKDRPFFQKIAPPHRLNKMRSFYERHGLLAIIVGRFIPFGARNCLFMSSGMSKSSFLKFALRDIVACFIWSVVAFSIFYSVGHNYDIINGHLKMFNAIVFSLFSISAGTAIWYKRKKIRS